MQITVTIPNEVAMQADALGLRPEAYVEALLANQLPAVSLTAATSARLADLEIFFTEIVANSAKIPMLPEDAFTRENFYRGRE